MPHLPLRTLTTRFFPLSLWGGLLTVLVMTACTRPQDQPPQPELTSAPDFREYSAGDSRKEAFYNYMVPLIQTANEQVLFQRKKLKSLFERPQSLSSDERDWINKIAEQYEVQPFDLLQQKDRQALLHRVDEVPVSLALAQAANESAWGTSKFARKGNNYYGQWCFQRGCGLVPSRRGQGKVHEVKRFEHPFESIKSYVLNLNSHPGYQSFRRIRSQLRDRQQTLTGIALAKGLQNYSQRKGAYVREIQNMIRYNKLSRFNLPKPTQPTSP